MFHFVDADIPSNKCTPSFVERNRNQSSEECPASATTHDQNDVANNHGHGFQPSVYSRSNSSFLIEDILFQRPKVIEQCYKKMKFRYVTQTLLLLRIF